MAGAGARVRRWSKATAGAVHRGSIHLQVGISGRGGMGWHAFFRPTAWRCARRAVETPLVGIERGRNVGTLTGLHNSAQSQGRCAYI